MRQEEFSKRMTELNASIKNLEAKKQELCEAYLDEHVKYDPGTAVTAPKEENSHVHVKCHVRDVEVSDDGTVLYLLNKAKKDGSPSKRHHGYAGFTEKQLGV